MSENEKKLAKLVASVVKAQAEVFSHVEAITNLQGRIIGILEGMEMKISQLEKKVEKL